MPTAPAGSSAHTKNLSSSKYRLNAQTWAKRFSARLLEPGIVSYADVGCGTAYLSKETIDRCINSFIGRPVVIRHTKTSPQNMKEIGHGYITNVSYNSTDGWWYGEGVVDTDDARRAIERDGFGSVGYHVNQTRKGGEYHCIQYDEEITDFSGEHLAIVDNPRYEGATIRLNSKPKTKPTMSMFKWFKPKSVASRENAGDLAAKAAADKAAADAAAATSRENSVAEDIAPETELEIAGGEKVTLGQLVEAHNSVKNGMDGDDEVMVNGKPVKLNALIAAYNAADGDDDADDKKKEKDKENAKNASDAKVAKEKTERENASKRGNLPNHFIRVLSARENGQTVTQTSSPDSLHDRINRGKAKYGSAAK